MTFIFAVSTILHCPRLTSYLSPKFKFAKIKLTISNSSDEGRSLTNFGTILAAIAPVGTISLNSIGPKPVLSAPRPALVPSPATLTTLVHNLSVCCQSLASASTIVPYSNAFPAGGTNLIKLPISRYFNTLVVYTLPTFIREASTALTK